MHVPDGLLQLSCVSVHLSACPSSGANWHTGTSRHLTEGTIGLSGTFLQKIRDIFSKTALLES